MDSGGRAGSFPVRFAVLGQAKGEGQTQKVEIVLRKNDVPGKGGRRQGGAECTCTVTLFVAPLTDRGVCNECSHSATRARTGLSHPRKTQEKRILWLSWTPPRPSPGPATCTVTLSTLWRVLPYRWRLLSPTTAPSALDTVLARPATLQEAQAPMTVTHNGGTS